MHFATLLDSTIVALPLLYTAWMALQFVNGLTLARKKAQPQAPTPIPAPAPAPAPMPEAKAPAPAPQSAPARAPEPAPGPAIQPVSEHLPASFPIPKRWTRRQLLAEAKRLRVPGYSRMETPPLQQAVEQALFAHLTGVTGQAKPE